MFTSGLESETSHLEDARISYWLNNGVDSIFTANVDRFLSVPYRFILQQNYPNPFNPLTHIEYSVPVQSYISLKVFNVLGQEVTTLIEGTRQPGNYDVNFTAAGLSTGVYFYRLIACNGKDKTVSISDIVKKLMVIK